MLSPARCVCYIGADIGLLAQVHSRALLDTHARAQGVFVKHLSTVWSKQDIVHAIVVLRLTVNFE